jgi:C-terminal processing protease CtpA/Prc/predicted small secreted protein
MKKIFRLLLLFSILLTACNAPAPQATQAGSDEPSTGTAVPETGPIPTHDHDFSGLTYAQAFDEMFAAARRIYAFNGMAGKEPEWDALQASLKPRIEAAEQEGNPESYFLALQDFTRGFKDGRANVGGELQVKIFQSAIAGGYGFAIRELDDSRVLVTYLTPQGPAAQAGMQVGAEVMEFNHQPVAQAIEAVSIWGAMPSTGSLLRYQKSRYLLRAPLGTQAEVTFANRGEDARTVTLTTFMENDSFAASSIFLNYDAQSPPVEHRSLPSGVGYIRISSTTDDREETGSLFKEALADLEAAGVSSLIIDLRVVVNLSPEPILPLTGLAGSLTEQDIPLGQFESFNEGTGQFEEKGELQVIHPEAVLHHFSKLILLIGPGCSNACELEAYALSQIPGTIVVGESASAGVLSDVTGGQFLMPSGLSLQIPTGRFVQPNGEILLEGEGLVPTVWVPINETNVLAGEDIVLNNAVAIATGQ